MKNNKYFLVKLILVFTKINDKNKIKTGTKHAEIYIKHSNINGSMLNLSEQSNCRINSINQKKSKNKIDLKTAFNCECFFDFDIKNISIDTIKQGTINNNKFCNIFICVLPTFYL